MMTLIREGGFSMWFILLFGAIALAAAGRFAVRPEARHVGFIHWMGGALLFATINGTWADLGAVFHYLANPPQPIEVGQSGRILLEGLGESMAPGIVGFAFM